MRILRTATLVALASIPLCAQSPFDGTWALNQQKSNMAGQTMTIQDAGNGAIKFVDPAFSVTVKTDGTKAQTPDGGTMSFMKKDNDNYHETDWLNGKEIQQSEWKLSNGGKTLTVNEHGTRPDGKQFSNTTTYSRSSGTVGLVGEWKSTAVKLGATQTFAMKLAGDQLTWDIPAIKATLKVKTDGKETHPTGPTVPKDLTLAVTKQGDRALAITEKLQGKTVFTGTYTVSADGKTITSEGKNAKGEATKEIWEKQGS